MSSGDQPPAKKARKGLCQKPAEKSKKAPLDDLPVSGDEASGDDIVQAGLKYNKAVVKEMLQRGLKVTTNMLLKRMKREPKLWTQGKISEFFETAEECSDTMTALITILARQAEKYKGNRGVKHKEKA